MSLGRRKLDDYDHDHDAAWSGHLGDGADHHHLGHVRACDQRAGQDRSADQCVCADRHGGANVDCDRRTTHQRVRRATPDRRMAGGARGLGHGRSVAGQWRRALLGRRADVRHRPIRDERRRAFLHCQLPSRGSVQWRRRRVVPVSRGARARCHPQSPAERDARERRFAGAHTHRADDDLRAERYAAHRRKRRLRSALLARGPVDDERRRAPAGRARGTVHHEHAGLSVLLQLPARRRLARRAARGRVAVGRARRRPLPIHRRSGRGSAIESARDRLGRSSTGMGSHS